MYKTGYRGIDELHGPIEEDTTIDDVVLQEAEDTFDLTIEEPEGEGNLLLENIGTEHIDPETWPFEQEFSNGTGVNVFMDGEEDDSAPYKMYQNGELVHDSFETAQHPAQLEITENVTLEPHFTELNQIDIGIEGEGNIGVEMRVEPYSENFTELEPIEEDIEELIPAAIEYRLTANAEGDYEFVGWYDEDETYSENDTLTQQFTEDTNITARFDQFHELEISVIDEENETVEGANVELADNETGVVEYQTTTDENGTALFAEVSQGAYEYVVAQDGYAEETGTLELLEDKEVTVELEEGEPEFDVSDFEVEVDEMEVTVTAEIENVGHAEGSIDLVIDDTAEETFTLEAGDYTSVDHTHEFEEEGEYTIELGDETETVDVEEPEPVAEIDVSELEIDTEYLTATITADVENVGDAEGTLDLMINDEVVYNLTLEAGETEEIDYTHEFDEAGTYTIDIGDLSETVEVEEEPSAEFEVSNIEIEIDDLEATITAEVENTDDFEDGFEVIVDGEVIETINIEGNTTEEIEVTHEFDEEGEYTIELGEETETVDVEDGDLLETEIVLGLFVIVVVMIALVGIRKGSSNEDESDLSDPDEVLEEEEEESFEEDFEDDEFEL